MNYQQTREALIKISPDFASLPEEWQWRINLEGANLYGAYLEGAYLYGANLEGAYLEGANLYGAYLKSAYLYGANLKSANLKSANLKSAYLYGATMNWRSHDLIAARLFEAAEDDIEKRKIAGLILISRDWCWNKFLKIDDSLAPWALAEMAKWVKDGDGAPEILRKGM